MRAWLTKLWVVASSTSLILSLLSLFEIIEWLGKLSKSLHFLASWWRFAVGSVFSYLGLSFSEISQTIIVLIAIAQSTATVHSLVVHRMTPLGFVFRRNSERRADDESPWEWPTGAARENYKPGFFDIEEIPWLSMGMAVMAIFTIVLCYESPQIFEIVKFSIIYSMFYYVLVRTGGLWPVINSTRNRLKIPKRITLSLIVFPAIPMGLIFFLPVTLLPFKKTVIWVLGFVIVLLCGNWIALNYLDSMLPVLDHLPAAPPPVGEKMVVTYD